MAGGLVCWHCGESLRGVARPIRHGTQCPACRADLHVCRLCRHHDPKALGECVHDRADRVVDKEAANYCTHFRPAAGAHGSGTNEPARKAEAELAALFGMSGEGDQAPGEPPDPAAARRADEDRARRELQSLFGMEEGTGDERTGDEPD